MKIFLMFVTWNGTKRELLSVPSLLDVQTLPSIPPIHIDTPRSGSSDTLRTTRFQTSTLIGMPAIAAPNSGEINLLEGPWPQDPLAQNIPVNLVTEGATALKPKPETTKQVRSARASYHRPIAFSHGHAPMAGLSKFVNVNRSTIPRIFHR